MPAEPRLRSLRHGRSCARTARRSGHRAIFAAAAGPAAATRPDRQCRRRGLAASRPGPAGRQDNLERPADAGAVRWMESRCRLGVEPCSSAHDCPPPRSRGHGREPPDRSPGRAQSRRAGCGYRGRFHRPGSGCAGSPCTSRSLAVPAQPSPPLNRAGRHPARRRADGRARFDRRRRCRAENPQVAIDLRAVGVDDHAADLLGKRERQAGLAAGGRPGNDDQRRFGRRHGHCDADSSGEAR